jgi:glycosyltransferase involved in cell wall biosynthesis
MAKAIVCVTNDLYTDQRVNKVCLVLKEQGYDVILVGRKRKNSLPLQNRPYNTHRIKLLFETGALFYTFFNLRLFLYLLFKKADLIVSNDLDTLLACYTAKRWKRNVQLVYDTHEYFTEVPELLERPRVRNVWLRIEKRIFPKLNKVYTVNQSISDIYREKYGVDVKVVRNISPKWSSDNPISKTELNIPEGIPLIIIQGAGINIDRGAEEAVEAMQKIDACLMIVGDGDVVPQLKKDVKILGLSEKVRFYGKQPYDRLMHYTYHADIGLTLDKPTSLNYKLSLPNKVFDYLHAETAIIATDIKEVAAIIRKHEIGEVLDQLSPMELANSINKLLNNPELLSKYKSNCKAASTEENWEKESLILKSIYPRVTNGE